MTLVLDEQKIEQAASGVFLRKVIENGCLDLWRRNLLSDQELIHKMTFLNVGCTKIAMTIVAEEIKDEHETHAGAAT